MAPSGFLQLISGIALTSVQTTASLTSRLTSIYTYDDSKLCTGIASLVESEGYPFERHDVVTQDGYVIEMHRIPRGREPCPEPCHREPVHHSSALAAFSTVRAPSCLAHSRRWWPVSAYSLQSLAVGVSVPPHVVPAHRDYGAVGPETVDDGRCPDLVFAPLRPSDFRSIQRAKNTPKTPAYCHHGRNRDCARDFSTAAGASACDFVVFAKRAY
ncbi:lipase member K-like [Ixodes scapularis]